MGFRRFVARATATTVVSGSLLFGGLVGAPDALAWDAKVWDRVAKCESGGNWKINTGNGYYGGLQFSSSTWKAFGGRKYARNAHQASKAEQIAIARRTLARQGPGAWPTCSRKAGLTKSNGGANSKATPGNSSSRSASTSRSATTSRAPGKLKVTGRMDKNTVKAMQKWVGASTDGIWGPKTTKALQKKVGAKQTGRRTKDMTKRLQRLVGSSPDGIWGPKTTKALQKYLNKR
ncbi:MAG: transglycosylase family protein [Propioniciclava sp.]